MKKIINFIKSMFEYRDRMDEGVTVRLPSDYCEFIGL